MKTDLYTKGVLTVIAICLTIMVCRDVIPEAKAGSENSFNGSIARYGLVPLNANGSVDVNIRSVAAPMDVSIVDINTSDELDINIDKVAGSSIYNAVPVKIKE